MPWYVFIHPALAVITMFYGVRIAQTGMNRVLDWDYPIRKQRRRSIIFLLLNLANFGLGLLVSMPLRNRELTVELLAHRPMAIIVIVLAGLSVVFGLIRSGQPGKVSSLMKIHPWLVLMSSVFILTMGYIGLLELFGL